MRNAECSKAAAITAIFILLMALPSVAATYTKTIAEGVILVQDINTDPKSPAILSILRIDPKKPGVKVVSALGKDFVSGADAAKGRETISAMVARKGAVAGINADFFPWTGDPLGLAIIGGGLVSEPCDRAAVGFTESGEVFFDKLSFNGTLTTSSGAMFPVRGINRQRGRNEMVLFTPLYGPSTGTKGGIELLLQVDRPVRANSDIPTAVVTVSLASDSPIPAGRAVLSAHGQAADWITQNVKSGDELALRFEIEADSGRDWSRVVEAVGGGPWLVKDGAIYVDSANQNFKPDIVIGRNPRTAVGVTRTGELLFVAVDGRQSISRGMSLGETAELMKNLGAVNAINLDGGGSTSLSVRGLVINSPSGGKERPVANALLVYAQQKSQAYPAVKFAEGIPVEAPSGAGRLITLLDEMTGSPASEESTSGLIWGTSGGIGFVNQKGYFVPVKSGKGAVIVLAGDKRLDLPVTVTPGKPMKLTAKIVPDPSGAPNVGQVTASLQDSNGNSIEGKLVTIAVKGGIADRASKTTDAQGASFFMTWDTTADAASVTVSAAGLTVKAK